MLRVHDTSAAHSDIYQELGMEKYGRELLLMHGKQDDARKARRKSDVLVDNWKEGRNTNEQGMNCQGHGILVLIAGTPNSDTDKLI